MDRALIFMLAFFGGGLGCLVRLLVDGTESGLSPVSVANVVACLLMGVSYALINHKVVTNKFVIAFVNVGVLGGLSTFSPLVLFALQTDMASNFALSLLILLGQLVFFVVVAVIGYIISALVLQYGFHKSRALSRLASSRILVTYKQTLPNFLTIHELYSFLITFEEDLKKGKLEHPLLKDCIEKLKPAVLKHLMFLVHLNELYLKYVGKEKCVAPSINELTTKARTNGIYLSDTDPTYNEQMELLKKIRHLVPNFFPEFPLDSLPEGMRKNLKGKDRAAQSERLWDTLLDSGNCLSPAAEAAAQGTTTTQAASTTSERKGPTKPRHTPRKKR